MLRCRKNLQPLVEMRTIKMCRHIVIPLREKHEYRSQEGYKIDGEDT